VSGYAARSIPVSWAPVFFAMPVFLSFWLLFNPSVTFFCYYYPWELERAIAGWVDHYNHE